MLFVIQMLLYYLVCSNEAFVQKSDTHRHELLTAYMRY